MLRQRVITAVVLLAFLLPALFAKPLWPFQWLTLAFIVAAGWEWARLNGGAGALPWALAAVTGLLAIGLALSVDGLAAAPCSVCDAGALLWVLGGGVALLLGPTGWLRVPRALRLAVGPVLLAVAWLGLTRAHAVGVNFLLSVLCLVWMADIAAYAGGRLLGRRKLAPSISPGKTWEGALTGAAGVLLLGAAWWAADRYFAADVPSVTTVLVDSFTWLGAAAVLLLLSGASVVGDLFESLVKRAAGAKDSSGLLPGHGGVLDRIDALLPVFPLVAALALR